MKDNFKNKMLLLLILNNYTSKRAIKSLLKGRSNASSTIKKLKEDGWIKERKVGYKAKNRKEKKITYYMITAHGFNCFLVMPGDNVTMEVELITPIAIEKGLRFAIREGGRTVGAGVVSEVEEK